MKNRLICLLLVFSVTIVIAAGCKKDDSAGDPEISVPVSVMLSGDLPSDETPSESPPPADTVSDDLFKYAYASVPKGSAAVDVTSAGGIPVSLEIDWDTLYYSLSNTVMQYLYDEGIERFYTDESERDRLLYESIQMLLSYAIYEIEASAEGFSLTDEQIAEITDYREYLTEMYAIQYGDGYFESMLWYYQLTPEVYDRMNMYDMLKSEFLKWKFKDEIADNAPDDNALGEYFADYGIYRAKHILLLTTAGDDEGNAAQLAKANDIIGELRRYKDTGVSDADFDKYFTSLMAEYGEDPGMQDAQSAIDGYTFASGAMVSEFYEGTAALQPYEFSAAPVVTSYGYHIIMRLPIDYDLYPIYSDGESSYTMRQEMEEYLLSVVSYDYTLSIDAKAAEFTYEKINDFAKIDLTEIFPRELVNEYFGIEG